MMSDFTSYKLSDVVINVIDNRGKTPPRTDEPTSYELLEVNSLKGSSKHPNYDVVKKYVSKETYENWFRKGHPKSGDVLISTVGSIGEVALSEGRGCIAQNIVALQTNKSILDSEYLYYLFTSDMMKNVFNALNISSVQPSIKVPHLLAQEVKLPSVSTQKEVVKVLKCLDNKINNNKAMNQTLEKLAQRIFKSWFIDFDPVKANKEGLPFDGLSPEIQALFPSEFEDSELGMIPKGWEVKSVGEVSYILNGYAFKSKDYVPEQDGTFVLRTKNFTNGFTERYQDDVFLPQSFFDSHSKYLSQEFDYHLVMVGASLGNTGMIFPHQLPAFRNQNMWSFRAKATEITSQYFIKHSLDNLIKSSFGLKTGSAREFFRKKDFGEQKICVPSKDIMHRFGGATDSLLYKVANNHAQNVTLTNLRDRLLPKLISGQISVDEAARELAEAV